MTIKYYDITHIETKIKVGGKTYEVIRRGVEINVGSDMDHYANPVDVRDIVAIRAIWDSPFSSKPCRRDLKMTAATAKRVIAHVAALVIPAITDIRAIYRMDDDEAKHFNIRINLHLLGLPDASEDSITDAYLYFKGN